MPDYSRLKNAIAIVETGSGTNNWPRLEPAFLPAARTFTVQGHLLVGSGVSFSAVAKKRFERWGMASAASYGPWQVLYHSACDFGGYPEDSAPWLLMDPAISEPIVDKLLARLERAGALEPADFFNGWNTGSPKRESPFLDRYLKAYGD